MVMFCQEKYDLKGKRRAILSKQFSLVVEILLLQVVDYNMRYSCRQLHFHHYCTVPRNNTFQTPQITFSYVFAYKLIGNIITLIRNHLFLT